MATQTAAQAANPERLQNFLFQVVQDLGAAMHASLVLSGDRLGLYKAMAGAGPLTSGELAERTQTDERYIREWLNANAAGGYVTYDPAARKYELPPEQAMALADEHGPAFVCGGFETLASMFADEPIVREAFRTGAGVGWHQHCRELFSGTERFFRASYQANLVANWIPALDGVEEKLKRGAEVADAGCGHGASTLIMAEAYPASRFVGYDYHEASIERARASARERGLTDRVRFEVAAAKEYPGTGYDLVCIFDALHDMGDPAGAAAHVYKTLKADGTWMVVEPFAADAVENNLNALGRVFYSASTMVCTPASRSQEVGLALGAQAGAARLQAVIESAGFRHVRKATETPFNIVLEARP